MAASARGAQAGSGERATVVSSTANGSVKKKQQVGAGLDVVGPEKRRESEREGGGRQRHTRGGGRSFPLARSPRQASAAAAAASTKYSGSRRPSRPSSATDTSRRFELSNSSGGRNGAAISTATVPAPDVARGARPPRRAARCRRRRRSLALASLSSPVVPSAAASPTSAAASRISPASRAPRPRAGARAPSRRRRLPSQLGGVRVLHGREQRRWRAGGRPRAQVAAAALARG